MKLLEKQSEAIMSICEVDKIDFCWRDKKNEGKLFLAFTDHLDWKNENEHLKLLQAKLNTYLSYVENENSYIQDENRKIFIRQNFHKFEIRIVFKKKPIKSCVVFLKKYSKWLKNYLLLDDYDIEIITDFSHIEKICWLRKYLLKIKNWFVLEK